MSQIPSFLPERTTKPQNMGVTRLSFLCGPKNYKSILYISQSLSSDILNIHQNQCHPPEKPQPRKPKSQLSAGMRNKVPGEIHKAQHLVTQSTRDAISRAEILRAGPWTSGSILGVGEVKIMH